MLFIRGGCKVLKKSDWYNAILGVYKRAERGKNGI